MSIFYLNFLFYVYNIEFGFFVPRKVTKKNMNKYVSGHSECGVIYGPNDFGKSKEVVVLKVSHLFHLMGPLGGAIGGVGRDGTLPSCLGQKKTR